MQYFVKRGYSYVNPETGKVTLPGQPLSEAKIDESQKWKLQATEVKPAASELPAVKKKAQTFDEATAAIIEMRDKKTAARRDARNEAQQKHVEAAKQEAAKVQSESVKKKKDIQPEDYVDPLDEGEETE